MKINGIFRSGCALLCAAAMMSFAAPAVLAQGVPLEVRCENEDGGLSGIQLKVYKVGVKNAEGKYEVTGDFKSYPVSLKEITTAAAAADAANTLENYAVLDKIAPLYQGETDKSGSFSAAELDEGLYMLCGEKYIQEGQWVIPTPSLIEVGSEELDSGETIKVVTKFELKKLPEESPAEYGVKKVWDILDQFTEKKPTSIKVGIYDNGELAEEVTLDEENNWEYYWQGEADHDWRVKEIEIPEGFTVVYRNNETLYQIENTYSITEGGGDDNPDSSKPDESKPEESVPDSSSKEETSSPDSAIGKDEESKTPSSSKSETSSVTDTSLPQTGSLWWPVPVLGGAGVILIAAGVRVSNKKK
ncbi:MAG: Cna B-type domain-containing protein [Ruminococcus sp.]|nr:Cna B-type domain-containing protein [Ruminococcus sp.]